MGVSGFGLKGFVDGMKDTYSFLNNIDRQKVADQQRADGIAYQHGRDAKNDARAEKSFGLQVTADNRAQRTSDNAQNAFDWEAKQRPHKEAVMKLQEQAAKLQYSNAQMTYEFQKETNPDRKSALKNQLEQSNLQLDSLKRAAKASTDKIALTQLSGISKALKTGDIKSLTQGDMSHMMSGLNYSFREDINKGAAQGEHKLITGGQVIDGNFHPEITVFDDSSKKLREGVWGEDRSAGDKQSVGINLTDLKKRIDQKIMIMSGGAETKLGEREKLGLQHKNKMAEIGATAKGKNKQSASVTKNDILEMKAMLKNSGIDPDIADAAAYQSAIHYKNAIKNGEDQNTVVQQVLGAVKGATKTTSGFLSDSHEFNPANFNLSGQSTPNQQPNEDMSHLWGNKPSSKAQSSPKNKQPNAKPQQKAKGIEPQPKPLGIFGQLKADAKPDPSSIDKKISDLESRQAQIKKSHKQGSPLSVEHTGNYQKLSRQIDKLKIERKSLLNQKSSFKSSPQRGINVR
ncbi:MAG: hypothetical protein R8M45_02170 [Ghiorsea sp.]